MMFVIETAFPLINDGLFFDHFLEAEAKPTKMSFVSNQLDKFAFYHEKRPPSLSGSF